MLVRDHHPGVGQVDGDAVGAVAEHLGPDVVGLEDRLEDLGADAAPLVDDGPARIAHGYQLRDGSTSVEPGGPYDPAAAIMAALSVHSSSGGMVRRARPATTSAARFLSSELAATPPATTTSLAGSCSNAASSFSSRASTTDCSKAAARSALASSGAFPPRSLRP